jgi:signal transduction histidine kinase
VQAEVRLSQVTVNGDPQTVDLRSANASRETKVLRLTAPVHRLQFDFNEGNPPGRPTSRLRYKLEGEDASWRDLPTKMRATIRFFDAQRTPIESVEYFLEGETPGWRGRVEASDFHSRSKQTIAPERAATAIVSFISHGGDTGIGIVGIDGVRLRVESAGDAAAQVFDLSIISGSNLDQPTGTPDRWERLQSTGLGIARLGIRPTPSPHPILVLEDDDPARYGNWVVKGESSIPVQAGDRLTLEWQTAHSIGRTGPGFVTYQHLKPGRYWFRVATAKANGELTGQEVSLPIEIVAPWHQRWEFWLVVAGLAGGAAIGLRQIALRRRMQRRLAEVEREQALERERARIARDLHDDIGAGLTEIAMQSDWVRRDIAPNTDAATLRRIERVCQSAVELTRSVDEIVWAVNPANDTLERFANYLTQAAKQFLDAAGLRVRFDVPLTLPAITLPGKVRHSLFQAVREALNNATKHAQADLVRLELKVETDGLRVVVEDNGCGFSPEQPGAAGTHEGLEGMRRRMEEIGGHFRVSSRPGSGTRIEFVVSLQPQETGR